MASAHPGWRVARRDDLIDYRDGYLLAINPSTGRRYATSTVSLRLGFILDFYSYADSQGWYVGELAEDNDEHHPRQKSREPWRNSASAGSRVRVPDLLPRRSLGARDVRPIDPRELRELLWSVGPRASEFGGCGRDRLIIDLGWSAGLRVGEIAALRLDSFKSMRPDPASPMSDERLLVQGKGGYKRVIAIPVWVALDALAYIAGTRKEARLRYADVDGDEARLFLSSASSKQPGKPLSTRRLQQVLESACLACGFVERKGGIRVCSARYTFHQLRHTYAVLTYIAEIELGNPEPWKKIQSQLGHRFLTTTIDTYLKYVALFHRGGQPIDIRLAAGL